MRKRGFSVVEIVIATAVLLILIAFTSIYAVRWRHQSKLARVSKDLVDLATGLSQFAEDNNYVYPPDTSRNLPPGLEKYLANNTWPKSVWPHGVFDWDNWTISGQKVFQVSYRLCDIDDPIAYCSDPVLFPTFTRNSAILYCISGSCVPHEAEPNAPAYCVNCLVKKMNY